MYLLDFCKRGVFCLWKRDRHNTPTKAGGGVALNTPVTLRMNDRLFLKAVQGRHIRKAAYLSL